MSTDGPQPTLTARVYDGATHAAHAVPPADAPGTCLERLGSRLRHGASKAARAFRAGRTPIGYAAAGLAVLTALWTALILRDLRAETASEMAAAQRSAASRMSPKSVSTPCSWPSAAPTCC